MLCAVGESVGRRLSLDDTLLQRAIHLRKIHWSGDGAPALKQRLVDRAGNGSNLQPLQVRGRSHLLLGCEDGPTATVVHDRDYLQARLLLRSSPHLITDRTVYDLPGGTDTSKEEREIER